jgi:IS4 transposase
LALGALKIIDYYRFRFQIEFLFRDAKQFTGLNHCQSRSKEKLNFHFNLSLAAINMANLKMKLNPALVSMNTFKRLAYNTRFANFLFKQLRPLVKVDINSPDVQQAIQLGRMWPKQPP